MLHEVKIPQQGLTTEYVYVNEICVKQGDAVAEGDILLKMESEKACLDLESPANGTVEQILVKEEDEAEIGQTVVVINTPD